MRAINFKIEDTIKDKDLDRLLVTYTARDLVMLQRWLIQVSPSLQPKEENNPKELLTIDEAAEFLSLSRASLYTMNCRRRIPFLKVSGKVFYRRSSLMQWLDSGERKTTAQLRQEVREGK